MEYKQKSIGRDAAIKLAESRWWKNGVFSSSQIVSVQLFTKELCMDFSDFHVAIEECLGRQVFTHEFGTNLKELIDEFLSR